VSNSAIVPRIALVGGLALAALPRALADSGSPDLKWLLIGAAAAIVVLALARFAATSTGSDTVAVVGDAGALGALAIGFPSTALVGAFVLVIAMHARRGSSWVALGASLLAYGLGLVIRLAAGIVPTGAWGDAISAIVLLGVVGVAVVVLMPSAASAASATVTSAAAAPAVGAYAEEAAEASEVAQTLSGSVGELEDLSRAFTNTIEDLTRELERQRSFTLDGTRHVREARAAAEQLHERAQAMEQAIGQLTAAASSSREAIDRASHTLVSVGDRVRASADRVRDLDEVSDRIGGFVERITRLARQTNLLALNAAIEAARAGEQGKGFAVVAEEVRKLAEESSAAAGEIAGLVGEIQNETNRVVDVVREGARRTDEGVSTVDQTRVAFERIGEAVESMSERVTEIAMAVRAIADDAQRAGDDVAEVAAVAEESSASAEQVSASTQQTSASAQEIAASAQTLSGTAEQLNALVNRFKVAA